MLNYLPYREFFTILAILILSGLLSASYLFIKRKIFIHSSHQEYKRWLGIVFIAAKFPLILIGVSYAIYYMLLPLFPYFSFSGKTDGVYDYFQHLLFLVKIIAASWFLYRILKFINGELIKLANRMKSKSGVIIAQFLSRNLKYIAALISLNIIIPLLPLPVNFRYYTAKLFQLILIGVISWLCLEIVAALEETILHRYQITTEDNLLARKVYTQIKVLKKIAFLIIFFLTIAAILMSFESFHQYGTSLLASAGLVTAIIGFAAQRSLASIIAGLQIAISQPIRLDDAVVIENEFGFVEEISLSYVVIRLWDWRRLILPINYFIEKPFQNWTRQSSTLLGSIFLYVDYTIPIDQLREELKRILDASLLWDKKVSVLQVSDAKADTLELRILASAKNAPTTWDLRCEIREKMISFIQKNYPDSLPKTRLSFTDTKKTG